MTSAADDAAIDSRAERRRSALALALFLLISAVVGTFVTLITREPLTTWYPDIPKAPWHLPLWLTGTVWPAMYILMSVAGWLVWRERHRRLVKPALTLYVAQQVLMTLWRPVLLLLYPVLGPTAFWLALVVAVLLAITVTALVREAWGIHRGAAIMLLPYLAWVVYIVAMNIALAMLNS